MLLTVTDLGVFANFQKNQNIKFKLVVSPRLRIPELLQPGGLVVTSKHYWGLLHKDLLWKGIGLLFSMGVGLSKNLDFVKNGIWKSITIYLQEEPVFLNFGGIVTFLMLVPFKSIDTNELLKKTVPQNMGYWQTNQKLKKKVSCFKVALG